MGFLGGAIVTANVISQWMNNARTKKDIQRIYKDTAKANYTSRAVFAMPHLNKTQLLLTAVDTTEMDDDIYVYDSKSTTPALDYIWGEHENPESIVISGGKSDERNRAMMPFIHKSQEKGIPIIVLHTGNKNLETVISGHSVAYEFISRTGQYYDAFRSLPVDDIVFLLYETMPDDIASPNAETLIKSLLEMLLRTDGKVTFQSLAAFPIANLMDKLNKLKADSEISEDEFDEISSNYISGSSEIAAVRTYLNKLNRQAESIYGKMTANVCNIKKILNMKGVVSIDVGLGNNDLILSFVVKQLLYYQSTGRDFAILIDGITLSRNKNLSDLLHGRIFAISHNDFVASLYGGEVKGDDMFVEITSGVNTIVLLNHKSGASCQKWSEYLGKYHKIKIKLNISQTSSFIAGGNTRGLTVEETDEPRVRAETISMLPDSLACVHNKNGTLFAEI